MPIPPEMHGVQVSRCRNARVRLACLQSSLSSPQRLLTLFLIGSSAATGRMRQAAGFTIFMLRTPYNTTSAKLIRPTVAPLSGRLGPAPNGLRQLEHKKDPANIAKPRP